MKSRESKNYRENSRSRQQHFRERDNLQQAERNQQSNRFQRQNSGSQVRNSSQENQNGFIKKKYDEDGTFGENLKKIDYSEIKLEPFLKVFYKQENQIHTDQVVSNYYSKEGIIIRSSHSQIPQPFMTWKETKLPKYIMEIIQEKDFPDPMPIQAQSIPIVLNGHDLIGIAQTGSGKTLSYILPALIHINAQDPVEEGQGPVALILAPTRELANQIKEVCTTFGSRCKTSSVCVYGGERKFIQESQLRRGCDVIIATPGRLIDFLSTNVTNMRRVTYLVLDEADRMLDMGFEPQIRKIVDQIRPDRQTLMFSATWPEQVRNLAKDFCDSNPIHIQVGNMENNVNKDIEQSVEVINRKYKFSKLKEILESISSNEKVIVFTQTKADCDQLSCGLKGEKFYNASIHGDKTQMERDEAMKLFKSGKVKILIATDIASRGLDVKDIKLVINFDFPNQIEDYVHRVGRTGRAGNSGRAITFIDPEKDQRSVRGLIKILKDSKQDVPTELIELSDQRNSYGINFNGRSSFNQFNGKGNKFRDNSQGRGFTHNEVYGKKNSIRDNSSGSGQYQGYNRKNSQSSQNSNNGYSFKQDNYQSYQNNAQGNQNYPYQRYKRDSQ